MTDSPHLARIDELEMKAAFQEQLIADLNDELLHHNARIDALEKQITKLIEHLHAPVDKSTSNPDDERPPHY